MAVKLLTMYNGIPAGTIIEPGAGVEVLLIQRKIAERVMPPQSKDLDRDGRAEGGPRGDKKAFTSPPQGKRR